jgi:hypothetical protein
MSQASLNRPGPLAVLAACCLCALLHIAPSAAQTPFSGYESVFSTLKSYTLYHTAAPLKIDGELNEKSWTDALWTDYFIDIEGEHRPTPTHKTRVKMLWDDRYLYIAAHMEEPHLWANKQAPSDIIFRDNVFKIFIDPNNDMNDNFEIQINPNNLMLFLHSPAGYPSDCNRESASKAP